MTHTEVTCYHIHVRLAGGVKETSGSMAPLLITPLYELARDSHVIHRVVRPRCNDKGEVETVLLRENGSERVVVRDRDTIHAFMELQDDSEALDDKNRMCWASFEDVQHSVFCVLASPTQVRLWDSTSFLGGGEGITCHLPFEASSIFPLKTGILVQRRLVGDDQEDDEMAFLSKPVVTPTQLSSLFSLSHPLKTLLPVANSGVLEQLVFVGTANDKQIAVTFHIELRRHAVWVLDDSPMLESFDLARNSDVEGPFVVEESFLRDDGSLYEGLQGVTSRKKALAEALGVGTRKSVDAVLSSPTNFTYGAAPLYPDLSMTLMYEAFHNNSDISKAIFLAGTFLCINTGTELQIWNVSNSEITHTACLPCTWAIPIQCIPPASFQPETDILVLNNSLQLYRGGRFLADVLVIANDYLVAMHDPVGNHFTLELHNGTRLRAELSLTLSPLVERVLKSLEAAVGDELALQIRFDCVRLIRDFANLTNHDPPWAALSCVVKKMLQRSDEQVTASEKSSSWHSLLRSGYHSTYEDQFSVLKYESIASSPLRASSIESISFMTRLSVNPYIQSHIFDAIHLLYEDFKLSMLTKPWCTVVRSLLRSCTTDAMTDFGEHYARDDEILAQAFDNPFNRQMGRRTTFDCPPSIMKWIMQSLNGCSETHKWIKSSLVTSTCPRLTLVHRVYSILASNSSDSFDVWRDEAIVNAMLVSGFDDSHFLQNDFPIGVALPLLEVLARCCCHPGNGELSNLAGKAWKFIGRKDLFKQNQGSERFDHTEELTIKSFEDDHDGLVGIEASHHLRFPNDNRLKEVAHLLRSSRPTFLKVPRAVELSDHDYERLKQERLLTLCRRVLALPLGRGMFTLGTLKPVPAEQLPIPELCLSGRVAPANNTLALDASHSPLDMTVWPNFHNGVAAGLRLPRVGENSSSFKITRSWIIYNKATQGETLESGDPLTHAHGGLLMALGLRGHLSALSMTDIYEYLTQGSVTTSVGVLLGMAANKRGTCDPSVSKMLCLHIPSLLPLSFSSIDVSAPAHAAAVTGIGLLYQGSSHRLMSEFLLNEMARRPANDASTVDREAYALSCGLALGMITLAKGGSGGNAGLADLEIEERLYRYVVGGVDDRANRRRQDIADRRVNTNGTSVGESERCARVHEGETINNDVTAPGALLALGLMYMKSRYVKGSVGRSTIANVLKPLIATKQWQQASRFRTLIFYLNILALIPSC
jgi:Anaphase-promoting complex subunit 1